MDAPNQKLTQNPVLKWCLLALGMLCTALAVLGIFLPLLPTVPLLLLAATCFARSSETCHNWLLEHNRLGPMIRGYLAGSGIPRRARNGAIVLLWLTITPSALLLVPLIWVRLLLFSVAFGVSIYLLRLPLLER
jgi:hypothetical protein